MPDLNRRARQILPNIVVVDAVLPGAAVTECRHRRARAAAAAVAPLDQFRTFYQREHQREPPARHWTSSPSSTPPRRTSDMRPLRLEVEGFTCYRDRQPPLDFSELSLFAIAGPTGAGKSSILDTMLYALFGKVPRIGKHGISEFISHGRDVMSVALDFRSRGRDYSVTRLSKRRRRAEDRRHTRRALGGWRRASPSRQAGERDGSSRCLDSATTSSSRRSYCRRASSRSS